MNVFIKCNVHELQMALLISLMMFRYFLQIPSDNYGNILILSY